MQSVVRAQFDRRMNVTTVLTLASCQCLSGSVCLKSHRGSSGSS